MNKILTKNNFLLSLLIVFATLFGVWRYGGEIFAPADRMAVSQAYSQSQYVLGEQAPAKIDDNTLYQYAADAYWRGEDPTTINFEHPPLGKYIFGLSLRLFDRVLVINVLFYVGCLALFARLAKQLKLSGSLTFLAVGYLALGSGLLGHLRTALFDLQILFWSLAFFNALFIPKETWQKHLLIGFVLGILIATKYFFPLLFLFLALWGLWAWRRHAIVKAVAGLLVTGLVYLASYAAFFLHQHSLLDFFRFEWFRFRWWTGDRTIPKLIILETLLRGKYHAWWLPNYQVLPSGDWNISWPLIFIFYLISLAKQKLNLQQAIIILYTLGLMAIYLFGSAVYGRYLLQLIPFWLIIIGWAWQNVQKNRR
jgi:predicted membrane-bound dolichyl-phosphate-mannose-protein mannosyltransferase